MKRKSKGRYHHGHLKDALVDATLKMVEKRGLVDFNLREVAATCGVSIAAVYRHYRSKDALIIEIANRGFRSLKAEFEKYQDRGAPGFGFAYVQFALQNEGYFRIMFSRNITEIPGFSRIESEATGTFHLLLTGLGVSSRSGGIPAPALRSWAVVHGLAFLWIDGSLPFTEEEFRLQVSQILFG